jgi:hypothetical protein
VHLKIERRFRTETETAAARRLERRQIDEQLRHVDAIVGRAACRNFSALNNERADRTVVQRCAPRYAQMRKRPAHLRCARNAAGNRHLREAERGQPGVQIEIAERGADVVSRVGDEFRELG